MKRNVIIMIAVAVVVLLLIAYFILRSDKQETTSSDNNEVTTSGSTTTDVPFDDPEIDSQSGTSSSGTGVSADVYYNNGLTEFKNANYSDAITDFDGAIRLNPGVANYYAKKSEALYNLGQKEQAITAVEDGLKILPNDDLLKTKLDILNKEYFGSQPQ